jgi:hypothetical protein
MFLWVDLILYDLKTLSKTSPYDVRQKLKTLPKSLPDLYERILLAIQPEDLDAAKNILRWVVWAERPLKLEELKTAVAIQPQHKSIYDLSEMVQLDFGSILRSVLGAIIKLQDDTVYLDYQSTKEFLREINSITNERFSSLQSNESNLHITTSCLKYLSFDEFENPALLKQLQWPFENGLVDYPFFHYSSFHWSDHMKQLDDELQRIQNETSLDTIRVC